jgi:hypothetical protein
MLGASPNALGVCSRCAAKASGRTLVGLRAGSRDVQEGALLVRVGFSSGSRGALRRSLARSEGVGGNGGLHGSCMELAVTSLEMGSLLP